MMTRFSLFSLVVLVAFAGCNSSTSSVPAAPPVVAGEYVGPVVDSVDGTLTGDVILSQHGSNLGGAMTIASSKVAGVASVALTVAGSTLSGSGVRDINGAACNFGITGTIVNGTITATYMGVNGCSRSGSWSLTQTCVGVSQSAARKAEGLSPAC